MLLCKIADAVLPPPWGQGVQSTMRRPKQHAKGKATAAGGQAGRKPWRHLERATVAAPYRTQVVNRCKAATEGKQGVRTMPVVYMQLPLPTAAGRAVGLQHWQQRSLRMRWAR